MIRFLTAGESHGKCLTLILEGVPAGLQLSAADINVDLKRRQMGYGRGGRMKIESDRAEITAGVRAGVTLGSPIALTIQNRDWENWQKVMSPESVAAEEVETRSVTRPRPGHADLAGGIKYGHKDLRNVLERASARETAAKVACGAIAKRILSEFDIRVMSFVRQIGGTGLLLADFLFLKSDDFEKLREQVESSPVRCPDPDAEKGMMEAIDAAKEAGDSLGGIFQVVAFNVPPGLGSHVHWDRRLDTRVAGAVMGIPAIKAVEIGLGFEVARRRGSQAHDEIYYEAGRGFYRKTNNAGGTEGGISNGEPIIVRAAMKPIPTLSQPLDSVDFISKEPFKASKERSDACAVPAAGVVGEAVVAIEIANALLEKFGGDSIEELKRNYESYMDYVSNI
ncbi:chorismate synthase [Candidatus Poribacteria bacterium]